MKERESWRTEAVATLRREVPDELEELLVGLPPVRWRDDAAAVEPLILRGWLVAAAQRGEPEPDAAMRKRAALLDRGDAAALAGWLLRAWIEHDVALPEIGADREAELRAIAERGAQLARRLGRGGTDAEARYRQLLAQEESRPPSSALAQRGLLAVVAACGAGGLVPEVERYLSARAQERPAQSRALLRMLSWIEGPAAERALAAARRLPALRDEADRLLAARAGRAG
ncbi:MAG: hypothetical protein D6696_05275 [Acidobacteria bacterium]|nr:MAG: hypothetical protein D6696_05275 [Acidobacteriota bacterium]